MQLTYVSIFSSLQNPFYKPFYGMVSSSIHEFYLMASIESNRVPRSGNFNFGNRKESRGEESGEYGASSIVFAAVLALNRSPHSLYVMAYYRHVQSTHCSSTNQAVSNGFSHANASIRPNCICKCKLYLRSVPLRQIRDVSNHEY